MRASWIRRCAVAAAFSIVVSACGGGASDGGTTATTTAAAPESSAPVTTPVTPSAGAELLIDGGVAITSIDEPVVGNGMTLTDWQADNLVRAAKAGAGRTGAQLRETYSLPADVVPIDHIVAAWLLEATTPAAESARGLMPQASMAILDAAVAAVDGTGVEQAIYPDAVLVLFTQDAINSVSADGAEVLESAFHAPARIDICSTLVTFYDGAMNAVLELLESAIGPWALEWGKKALGLIPTPTAINIPKKADELGVFQALGLVLSLAGAISPWVATLTVEPGDVIPYGVAPGVGNEGVARVVVDPGFSIEWPAAVKSCADLVGLTLPSLDPVGATVEWTPELNGHADEFDRFVVIQKIDDRYESTLKFRTHVESAEQAAGTPVEGLMSIQASVQRPGDQTFRSIVEKVVERALGSGTIAAVLQSVLGDLVSTLDEINNPAPMYAFVSAQFHEPPPDPPSTDPTTSDVPTTAADDRSACVDVDLFSSPQGEMPGGVRLRLSPNGTLVFDLNGSQPTTQDAAGVEVTIQFAGTITGRWTRTGDTFQTSKTRVDIGGIVTIAGAEVALTPADIAALADGVTDESLTCSAEGTLTVDRTGQVFS